MLCWFAFTESLLYVPPFSYLFKLFAMHAGGKAHAPRLGPPLETQLPVLHPSPVPKKSTHFMRAGVCKQNVVKGRAVGTPPSHRSIEGTTSMMSEDAAYKSVMKVLDWNVCDPAVTSQEWRMCEVGFKQMIAYKKQAHAYPAHELELRREVESLRQELEKTIAVLHVKDEVLKELRILFRH